jgi:hypothetical protein
VTVLVNGDLIIANNPELSTLSWTPSTLPATGSNFTNIGGDFNISDCPKITNVALSGIGIKSIAGSLNITDNDALTHISLLDLTSIGGVVLISDCNAFTDIYLPNLGSIGGDFSITNNTHLSNVTGFPSLQTILGKLDFEGNFSM